MTRAILDTAVFLWWISDHSPLSRTASEFISNANSEPLISAASLWEILIKARTGLLNFQQPVGHFLTEQIAKNNFTVLPIEGRHVLGLLELPDHHADPFDRLIIAQSRVENIPILTADPQISAYEVSVVW